MIKDYIKENQERILDELFSLIRIPSVSAQPEKHGKDMIRCAERWQELLLMAGVDKAEVMPTEGNPVVYGAFGRVEPTTIKVNRSFKQRLSNIL